MKFINTVNQICGSFPQGVFDLQNWREYAAGIHPALAGKCEDDIKDYNFQQDILPVIDRALRHRERLRQLGVNCEKTVDALRSRLPDLFHEEPELDIILYLGLCSGAGWATTLGGKDVILLGVEKIVELDWDDEDTLKNLIFHELGHLWHRLYGQMYFPASTQRQRSLLQLYQEGIAMVCEQILCGDGSYYHQEKDGWLSWCKEHESAIKREFCLRLEREESTQDFFGDWCSFQGYSDVGYFLGCQFIKWLQEDHALTEIADMPYDVLWPAFIRFAQSDK